MPRRIVSAISIALMALSSSDAMAESHGIFLEVSKSDAGFTIEAEDATLPQVLSALGEKAGFAVQDTGAQRPPIPVFEVRDATLETALRQLLGTANHLIVYRGGSAGKIEDGAIEKIVLLSPGKRERVAGGPVSSLAGPGAVAPTPAPANRDIVIRPAPGADPGDFVEQEQEQLEYGATLEEMEEEMVEQLGVDPQDVETGEPGMNPGIPPDVVDKLEAAAYADGELEPPEIVEPLR